jgi:hypothetical protein
MPLLVQHASGSNTNGTSATATFGANTTIGNCLVAALSGATSGTIPTVSSVKIGGVADNWATAKEGTQSTAGLRTAIWTDLGCTQTATAVAVVMSASCGLAIDAFEFSGVKTSGAVDKSNTGNGTSSPWSSGSTGTLTQASEIAVGVVGDLDSTNSSVTITGPSSPWNNEAQVGFVNGITGTGQAQMSGYQIVNATTALTYSGTVTMGTAAFNAAVIVTLEAAPPAGGGAPQLSAPGRQSPMALGVPLSAPSPGPQSPPAGQAVSAPLVPPGRQSPMALASGLHPGSQAPPAVPPPPFQPTYSPATPPGRQSPMAFGLGLSAPSPAPQSPPAGQAVPPPLTPPGRQSPMAFAVPLYQPPPGPQTAPVPPPPPQPAYYAPTPPGRLSPMALAVPLYAPSPGPQAPPVTPPGPSFAGPLPQADYDRPWLKRQRAKWYRHGPPLDSWYGSEIPAGVGAAYLAGGWLAEAGPHDPDPDAPAPVPVSAGLPDPGEQPDRRVRRRAKLGQRIRGSNRPGRPVWTRDAVVPAAGSAFDKQRSERLINSYRLPRPGWRSTGEYPLPVAKRRQ